jgi:hypothetical protein
MGNLFAMSAFDKSASGSTTIDGSGVVSGTNDEAGQGFADYGDAFSGLTGTVPDQFGVYSIEAGSTPLVLCYLVDPSVSGQLVSGSTTPYGTAICMDASSSNPVVQQSQQVP